MTSTKYIGMDVHKDQCGPTESQGRLAQSIPAGTIRRLSVLSRGPQLLPPRVPSSSVRGLSECHFFWAKLAGISEKHGSPRTHLMQHPKNISLLQGPSVCSRKHVTARLGNHKVDLHGTLKTDAEFSHMTSGFKSVLLKPFNVFFKKKSAGAVIPAHLIGTYEHPETGLDIIPKGAPQQSQPSTDRSAADPGNGNGKE